MESAIQQEIQSFDAKNSSTLKARCLDCDEKILQSALQRLLKVPEVNDNGLSWLIKFCVDHKYPVEEATKLWIQNKLVNSDEWPCQLHLLQVLDRTFPELNFQSLTTDRLFNRFNYLISSDNKFVRAWSYHALIFIAHHERAYVKPVAQMCNVAMKTESASVKARIRNAQKQYPLDF